MNKVLTNCRVLQYEKDSYYIAESDIYIRDGKICGRMNDAEAIDLHNQIVLPAYFNIHSHLGESVFKEISGNEWTLSKYLEYTEEHNRLLSVKEKEEEWYNSACYSAEEMLKNGTTGFCAARSANVANQFQMNTMAGYPLMLSAKLKSYMEAGEIGFSEYCKAYKSEKNSIGIFLHSLYKSDERILQLARKCVDLGAEFITVHVAEDEDSRIEEIRKYGKSPLEVLAEYSLLNEKTILVHGGYLSGDELELVKESGATIAVCPISNEFLNAKMVDIELLENMKISWCIASDGLGTGRTFSLLEQVKKAYSVYPNINLCNYFSAITNRPAKCYARKHYTGVIEPKTEARFITVNYNGNNVEELFSMLFNDKLKSEYFY